MKLMSKISLWSVVILLCAVAGQALHATTVYNNSTTRSTPNFFASQGTEFGDEITLAGGSPTSAYLLTNFVFEYYATVAQNVDFRIYANNGSVYGTNNANQNVYEPGTLLYDSGAFAIGAGTNTLIYGGISVPVPQGSDITWTVDFSGAAGTAGLSLFDPPTVGSSASYYWDNNAGWTLMQTNGHAGFQT